MSAAVLMGQPVTRSVRTQSGDMCAPVGRGTMSLE